MKRFDPKETSELAKRTVSAEKLLKAAVEKENRAKAAAEKAARDAQMAEREKRMNTCREVNRILGRPEPTWESCLDQEESRRIGAGVMERSQEAERERQIRYNQHEAFKECDENPHALFCDRR